VRKFVLLFSLLAVPVSGQVCTSESPDETTAIQAAVVAGSPVNFEPRLYCVDARMGIRIPSDRTLRLNGATIGIKPGCTQHCKAFETVPGAQNVRIVGPGTVVGDLTLAVGFSIGLRVDSAVHFEMERVTFVDWRTDSIWAGGNGGSHNVRLYRVSVDGFGRNGISVVDGTGFVLDEVHCKRSLGNNPGACVDAEANPPDDQVIGLTIVNGLFEDARIGLYLHSGKGQQMQNVRVIGNTIRNNYLYGIILNSTRHAFLLDNVVEVPAQTPGQPIPVGISVGVTMPTPGSFSTSPIWAEDVVVSGNTVTGTSRALVLAGVTGSKIGPNTFVGGTQQIVAPAPGLAGMAGLMLFTP
jgi:hypothetical protein